MNKFSAVPRAFLEQHLSLCRSAKKSGKHLKIEQLQNENTKLHCKTTRPENRIFVRTLTNDDNNIGIHSFIKFINRGYYDRRK